MATDKVYRGTL